MSRVTPSAFHKHTHPTSFPYADGGGVCVLSNHEEARDRNITIRYLIVQPRFSEAPYTGLSELSLGPGERFQLIHFILMRPHVPHNVFRHTGFKPLSLQPLFNPCSTAPRSPSQFFGYCRLFNRKDNSCSQCKELITCVNKSSHALAVIHEEHSDVALPLLQVAQHRVESFSDGVFRSVCISREQI